MNRVGRPGRGDGVVGVGGASTYIPVQFIRGSTFVVFDPAARRLLEHRSVNPSSAASSRSARPQSGCGRGPGRFCSPDRSRSAPIRDLRPSDSVLHPHDRRLHGVHGFPLDPQLGEFIRPPSYSGSRRRRTIFAIKLEPRSLGAGRPAQSTKPPASTGPRAKDLTWWSPLARKRTRPPSRPLPRAAVSLYRVIHVTRRSGPGAPAHEHVRYRSSYEQAGGRRAPDADGSPHRRPAADLPPAHRLHLRRERGSSSRADREYHTRTQRERERLTANGARACRRANA